MRAKAIARQGCRMSLIQGANGNDAAARGKRRRALPAVTVAVKPPSATERRDQTGVDGSAPPFRMPKFRPPKFSSRIVDIRDHGAVPGGRLDCTVAIADAIAKCAKAGGGRVLVPPGEWATGPIHLKSNINLHLAEGSKLRFSCDPGQYLPAVFVRWGGQECYNYSPLIYARDCDNIAITGSGQILGQGAPWWGWAKRQQQVQQKLMQLVLQGVPVEDRRFGTSELPLRPQLIAPINCTNVLLEDFTVAEPGPGLTVHLAYCQNVTVRRVQVLAPDGPNTDGIVIDSSTAVLVEDCELHTNGDCISLNAGLNEDGFRVARPTENVIVRRIRATAGTGGLSVGSEMSGGVRNVLVHDCHYDGLGAGLRVKAARGRGGVVEQVFLRDITMGRIHGDAIQVIADYPLFATATGKAPLFKDIHFRNVTCRHANTAARLTGLPDSMLSEITLQNITISADDGLHCTSARNLRLLNVRITPHSGPVLSLRDTQGVLIDGLNNAESASVFLDLRGRQTREIRLRGESNNHVRPAIVLGVDVPKDAIVHE
jgi:polygalacturonase